MAGSAVITNTLPPKAAQDNAVWWVNTQGFPKQGGTMSTHMDNFASDPSKSSGLAIGGFHYYVDPNTLATRPVNPGETWDYATASTQLQIQQSMFFSTAVAKEPSLAYASPEVQSVATSAAMGGNGSLNPFIKNWRDAGGPSDPGGTGVDSLNPAAYGNYGMTSRDSGFLQAYAGSGGDAQSGLAALGGSNASGGMQAGMSALQGGGTNVATPPTKNGNSSAGCIGAAIGAIASIAAAGLLSGVATSISGAMGFAAGSLGSSVVSGVVNGVTQAMASSLGSVVASVLSGRPISLTGILMNIAGGAVGGAFSAIGSAAMNAIGNLGASSGLSSIMGNISPAISNILSQALVTGVTQGLSNLMHPIATAPGFNMPNLVAQWAANGGTVGMIQNVGNNILGKGPGGNLTNFINNINSASAFAQVANTMIGHANDAAGAKFGAVNPGGLGNNFHNWNDIMSFGTTSLTRNLNGAAKDMLAMGIFNISNLLRIMAPANVGYQIMAAGLGTVTGLTQALIAAQIPVAGLDTPQNDAAVQKILDGITDEQALGAVSVNFNLNRQIYNLGELTSFSYMCPNFSKSSVAKNWHDLGQQFISIGIVRATTFADVAAALAKIDPGLNLNHLSQLSTPYDPATIKLINSTFGWGGGTVGEITMADFIGTAAGYVHTDTLPYITAANQAIGKLPEGIELIRRIQILRNAISGYYTQPPSDGGENGAGATKGFVMITSSLYVTGANGTNTVQNFGSTPFDGIQYETLDDLITAYCPYIEAQLTVIANIQDPELQATIAASEKAHNASCAQIIKEAYLCDKFGIKLTDTNVLNSPMSAYLFANTLPTYSQQTGYGQIGDYMKRIAADNLYGDAIRGAIAMGNNRDILQPLGVNTERFNYPQSQYYRDPLGFYQGMYTGPQAYTPFNLQDTVLPADPNAAYIEVRNSNLRNFGIDPNALLPAQADEAFYDIMWQNVNENVRQGLGLSILSDILNRNVRFEGNAAYLIGLDKGKTIFATATAKGLLLTNNNVFVANLLAIINKVLYGNIGATKYDNPFFTDQMVYGVMELLGQLTPANSTALAHTLLGSAISGLLDQFKSVFDILLQNTDTGLDRNLTQAWGGVGPDGLYDPATKKNS